MSKKTTVEYKKLKTAIIKSAFKSGGKTDSAFGIDFNKLTELVAPMNLVPVIDGTKESGNISKRISTLDTAPLNEYFMEQKLEWFDKSKWISYLIFVDSTVQDETMSALLSDIASKPTDNPDVDHIKALATLVADYPCYFACVISYRSNNPSFIDSNSYIVVCRANKVIIRNPEVAYPDRSIPENNTGD